MLCLVSGCKSTRRLCRGCVGILKKGLRLKGCLPLHITNGMQPSLKTPRATPRKGRNRYLCGVKPRNTQSHDSSYDFHFDFYRRRCSSRRFCVCCHTFCNRQGIRWKMPEIRWWFRAWEICEKKTKTPCIPLKAVALLRWLTWLFLVICEWWPTTEIKCPFPTQTACVPLEQIQTTHAVFLWTQKKSKK